MKLHRLFACWSLCACLGLLSGAEYLLGVDPGLEPADERLFFSARREWVRQGIVMYLTACGHRVLDQGLGDSDNAQVEALRCRVLDPEEDQEDGVVVELQLEDGPPVMERIACANAMPPDDGVQFWEHLEETMPDLLAKLGIEASLRAWSEEPIPETAGNGQGLVEHVLDARALHRQWQKEGPSPAVIACLARTYAELSKDFDWTLGFAGQICAARAALLAAWLRHKGHETLGLWTEVYVRALTGQTLMARSRIERLKEAGAEKPSWFAGIKALLDQHPIELERLAEADSPHAQRYRRWGAYLVEFCSLDGVHDGVRTGRANPNQGIREAMLRRACRQGSHDLRLIAQIGCRRGVVNLDERPRRVRDLLIGEFLPHARVACDMEEINGVGLATDWTRWLEELRGRADMGIPSWRSLAQQSNDVLCVLAWRAINDRAFRFSRQDEALQELVGLTEGPLADHRFRDLFVLYNGSDRQASAAIRRLAPIIPTGSISLERLRLHLGRSKRAGKRWARSDVGWEQLHMAMYADLDYSLWHDLRIYRYLDYHAEFHIGVRAKHLREEVRRHPPGILLYLSMLEGRGGGLPKKQIGEIVQRCEGNPLTLPILLAASRKRQAKVDVMPMLRQVVDRWPDAWVLGRLAQMQKREGDEAAWLETRRRRLEIIEDPHLLIRAQRDLVVDLLDLKRYREAEELAREILATNNRSRRAHKLLAISLEAQDKMAEADEAWRASAEAWVVEMNRGYFARSSWYLFRLRNDIGETDETYIASSYGNCPNKALRALLAGEPDVAWELLQTYVGDGKQALWFMIFAATAAHQFGDREARDRALQKIQDNGQTYGRTYGKRLKQLAAFYASQPLNGGATFREEGKTFLAAVQADDVPYICFLLGRVEELRGHIAEAKSWYARARLALHRDPEQVGALARVFLQRLDRLHPDIAPAVEKRHRGKGEKRKGQERTGRGDRQENDSEHQDDDASGF